MHANTLDLVMSLDLRGLALLEILFHKEGRLMVDQRSSFHEVPQDLQPYPNFLVFVVENSGSIFQDILLSTIVTI